MKKQNSSNHLNLQSMTSNCPITSTVLAIGGRWKIIIIWQLKDGALRYGEIRKAIPGISEKMLIQQLRDLTANGWISKRDYQEIPPKTDYRLTPLGKSFIPVLQHIYDWGAKHKITGLPDRKALKNSGPSI